ncbi:MAG: heme lyase CcmF/NrfE family subunit [Dehalococcoidales bacterium]|nr:heme lyase CcmF/NrfE family subunit [Dehalococcoidales bacterium]
MIIALPVAAFSIVTAIIGVRAESARLMKAARNGILVIFGLYTLALAIILYAFFTRDYTLTIVAEHASNDLPALYTLSALYAGKAGSMFFWGWLVSLFAALLVWQAGSNERRTLSYAVAVLAVIEAFYIALVTFSVNIFEVYPSRPADGFGLNPLLQNFGMLIHPPLLYIGFAGFAVAFAMVIAAFITRDAGARWNSLMRRWAVFAWCVLGIGNLVGMWWSYNELGWGGYWAWDPVENAGLMPWLLGTAFLHSVAVKGRRDYMNSWSFCLVVFTFVFTLLSPFITHGGIESPLHGFYGSPFPPFISGAMIIVVVASMVLLYFRRRDLTKTEKYASLISRENAFLLTNIILVVLAGVILIGTVLPRVVEVAGGAKIAIDRSFYDRTCGPIMLLLVFIMGVCPLFGWGKSAWKHAGRNVIFYILAVIIIAAAVWFSKIGNWYIAAVVLCGLPLFVIFREWWRGTAARRKSTGKNCVSAFFAVINGNRTRYGGMLAHIGIVVITLGIIASSFYNVEKTATLDIGESMSAGKYELSYNGLVFRQDSTKISAVADVQVSADGKPVAVMRPSYAYWFSRDDFFAEVAVRTTGAEDLFVSLMWTDFDPADKAATFRVLVNPLVVWIWTGGAFFLVGGALSIAWRERQPAGVEE